VRQGFPAFQAAQSTDPTAVPANIQPARMVWPIPQGQIDLNPALTQNTGY
jgi:hypothetical protein